MRRHHSEASCAGESPVKTGYRYVAPEAHSQESDKVQEGQVLGTQAIYTSQEFIEKKEFKGRSLMG